MNPKRRKSLFDPVEYNSDKIRRILSEHGWFNHGDENSYSKLLRASDDQIFDFDDIASMIYVNSDADYAEIRSVLKVELLHC